MRSPLVERWMEGARFLVRQAVLSSFGMSIRRTLLMWVMWWLLAFFAGAAFVDASAMGLLLALQGLVGCVALAASGLGSNLGPVRFMGMGTAVGAAVSTLSFQLLLLFVDGVQPLILTAAMAIVGVLSLSRTSSDNSVGSDSLVQAAGVILLALVALGMTTGWHLLHALVLGVSLVVLALLGRRSIILSTPRAFLVLFGPTIAVGWWFRQSVEFALLSRILWDGDNSIFQLLINTTERWGVLENVGASGQSPIVGYHWATFAWLGMLEGAANAAPWVTLQFVMPLVTSVVVASAMWEFASSLSKSRTLVFVGVLVSMTVFFTPAGSVSLYVSDVWLVALLILIWRYFQADSFKQITPLLAVIFLMVLLGKKSSGTLLLGALIGAVALALLVQRSLVRRLGLLTALFATVFVVEQIILQFGSRILSEEPIGIVDGGGRVRLEFISVDAFGYAGTLQLPQAIIVALFVSITLLAVPIAAGLFQGLRARHEAHWLAFSSSATLTALFVPFTLGGERLATFYYSRHLGVVVGAFVLLSLLARLHIERHEVRGIAVVASLTVLVSILWHFRVDVILERITSNPSLIQLATEALWIPSIVTTLLVGYFLRTKDRVRDLPRLILLMVALVMVGSATIRQMGELRTDRLAPLFASSYDNPDMDLPNADLVDVGAWISANTDRDELIASNYFCESRENFNMDCSRSDWWSDWIRRAEQVDAFGSACRVETAEELGRIQNYFLPSLSDRRFLVQGPGFSLGCTPPPKWVSERIDLSESFARNPDLESCKALLDSGVTFFVVDLRTTDRTDWNGFAVSRLSNDSFVVLELEKGVCGAP